MLPAAATAYQIHMRFPCVARGVFSRLLDDDENRGGLFLIKPRCFVEEEYADEVIDKSN
jgi:hypothetical protein